MDRSTIMAVHNCRGAEKGPMIDLAWKIDRASPRDPAVGNVGMRKSKREGGDMILAALYKITGYRRNTGDCV
jgi:hypothetical protein